MAKHHSGARGKAQFVCFVHYVQPFLRTTLPVRYEAAHTVVASQFIKDATNTRIREVTLSYSLNSPGFRAATKLTSIDFSLTGRNLLIWGPDINYIGNDPETNLTGVSNGRGLEYFNNPSTRSYLFTIKINY